MTAVEDCTGAGPAPDGTGCPPGGEAARWELLRALGACVETPPPANEPLVEILGLPRWTSEAHTRVFVLDAVPYASVYLSVEGKLGGEAADRIAGLWRTLALSPPTGADHLANVLMLYAELGEAAQQTRGSLTRRRLDHARAVVLWEHLWSWVPAYLDAVSAYGSPAGQWAALLDQSLTRETALTPPAADLPLALRSAPPAQEPFAGLAELTGAVTAPLLSGFVLTHLDLALAADELGLGLRRGERRFVLDSLLSQDTRAVLDWLSRHARRWEALHRARRSVAFDPWPWWAERAAQSAAGLSAAAEDAAAG